MKTFLEIVAKDLYQKCNGNFQDLTVIFPNKRASLFFNQHIFAIANAPLWAPRYQTITELFQTLSPLEVADPIELVCRLYKAYEEVYQQSGGEMNETLDRFYSWGELMLSDFQDIDNNHVDAHELFVNISDLNDLTRFDYLTDEQVKSLQEYFKDFNPSTLLKENYMSLWKMLPTIYTRFREQLRRAGLSYEGMLKRNVVSRLTQAELPTDETLTPKQEVIAQQKVADFKERIQHQKFAIVGFNVLNKTEQELFRFLKENSQTYFYWDFDEAYRLKEDKGQKREAWSVKNEEKNKRTKDEEDASFFNLQSSLSGFEAGRFIYKDMLDFPNEFKFGTDIYQQAYNNFTSDKKHITYISSPTENAQTQYIGKWMQQCHLQAEGEQLNQSAIVLCNENLLQSVLHSIPVDEEFAKRFKLNVTMGYPLMQTPISSYLMAVLDLQLHGCQENRANGTTFWRYPQVAAVLKHPYTIRLGGDNARNLLTTLHTSPFTFHSSLSSLHENQQDKEKKEQEKQQKEFLLKLFVKQNTMKDLLAYLLQLIQAVGNSYRHEEKQRKEEQSAKDSLPHREGWGESSSLSFDHQLYVESIFNAYKIVNRLSKLEESGILRFEPSTPNFSLFTFHFSLLSRLLFQIINAHSLPFHGEPAVGIQVMGVLETRNLDFKNLLMLSVNEGKLPKSENCSSFIPYFLREEHHLTTRDKRNSLYAYYFYRLLQRAENVTLIYNNSTQGTSRGEMSRFMKQMLVEQEELQLANKIQLKNLTATNAPHLPSTIVVPKTEELLRNLRAHYVQSTKDKEQSTKDKEQRTKDKEQSTKDKEQSTKDSLHASHSTLHASLSTLHASHSTLHALSAKDKEQSTSPKLHFLSPSAINTFIDCPLKFYFEKVAHLNPEDEPTDDVEDSTFGSIFHFCMKEIYERLGVGKPLMATDIDTILSHDEIVNHFVDRAFNKEFFHESDLDKTPTYNGEQLLNRSVIATYAKNQLQYDRQFCPLTILEMEKEHTALFPLPDGTSVKLGGIIDRIDRVHLPDGTDQLRIVDYKTSSTANTSKSIEALFNPKAPKRSHHIMQAFYYADIYSREESVKQAVGVSLMYVKLTNGGEKDDKSCKPLVMLDTTEVRDFANQNDPADTDKTLRQAYHAQLIQVIQQIFDPQQPFTQATTNQPCMYCKFLDICGREKTAH